jgi:RNA polymerase sigma-70 factor, ECF subfamily
MYCLSPMKDRRVMPRLTLGGSGGSVQAASPRPRDLSSGRSRDFFRDFRTIRPRIAGFSLKREMWKMNSTRSKVDEWAERAASGDEAARERLLDYYRPNLRRIVVGRLDKRLASRVDPSDIVQETMIDADRRLEKFLRQPTVPLLVWLGRIATERVIDTHRRHLVSQRRSVVREHRETHPLDGSARELIQLIANGKTSPSGELMREEEIERIRSAIDTLSARDREILVMRHFDQMDPDAIAQVLGISPGAVRARILRALLRLRTILETP